MSNDIKKKQLDQLLNDIRFAAHTVIDLGVQEDVEYIVMDMALSAYEFAMYKQIQDKFVPPKMEELSAKVIEFKSKKEGN